MKNIKALLKFMLPLIIEALEKNTALRNKMQSALGSGFSNKGKFNEWMDGLVNNLKAKSDFVEVIPK